ncbi:MAG: response regulator [Lachnospiraceae bacterium]|jgi:two-component system chemotaxis response regulator CheY|nr:response regulator [Lachnospiraceae bacterium]MBQ9580568.1 response regulator [Lachnospiraceae bacterium]MBR0434968.1 response regulator [Lachnospiraceae bacterium]MCR5345898.1 response regulator [Lachnospiraceae bacterium]
MNSQDLKILISDDSILARKQLKDVLTSAGYDNFVEAKDGKEAVSLYKKGDIDIVFLDIVMPQIDGIEAIKQIKAVDENANIVMVSSVGTQGQIKAAIEAGAKDFIQKPFVSNQILTVLDNIVKGN